MKRTYKLYILIILLIFILPLLTGCTEVDEVTLLKEKLNSEIAYLDNELLTMLNSLNNISFVNYKVVVEEITEPSQQSGDASSGGGEGDSSSQSGGGEEQEASQKIEKGTNATPNLSSMVPNNILNENRDDIDWTTLKQDIEIIYSSWSVILSDLYKIGIKNEDILNFSKDLEQSIISIKNEDKQASLTNLSKLYSYIPTYLDQYSDDELYKNIQKTKSNIMNAYSIVEQDNWDEISRYVLEAEKYFTINVNNVDLNESMHSRINKVYTLLKELQNCLQLRDKDVFYIKYRNLIEELNSL